MRSRYAVAAAGVLAVAAVAVLVLRFPGSDPATASADPLDLPTVRVEPRDLMIDHEVVGALEPTSSLDVTAPAAGTVVEVAPSGSVVGSGSILAVVGDEPVAVLEGELPAWRDLVVGDEGPDVEQLETALVSAGFDPDGVITVDEEYTSATAEMVEDWQEEIGAEPTGEVRHGAVVFLPEPMRVESVAVEPGALVAAGDTLVGLASLGRVAVADVPVADVAALAPGDPVTVRLPDRETLDGTVATVVAQTDTSTRRLTVELPGAPESLAGLGAVDVDVLWTEAVAEDVATLPATAFRRLEDGTYVVDVVDGGELRALTVEPGRQVGSRVEVAGVPRDADVVAP